MTIQMSLYHPPQQQILLLLLLLLLALLLPSPSPTMAPLHPMLLLLLLRPLQQVSPMRFSNVIKPWLPAILPKLHWPHYKPSMPMCSSASTLCATSAIRCSNNYIHCAVRAHSSSSSCLAITALQSASLIMAIYSTDDCLLAHSHRDHHRTRQPSKRSAALHCDAGSRRDRRLAQGFGGAPNHSCPITRQPHSRRQRARRRCAIAHCRWNHARDGWALLAIHHRHHHHQPAGSGDYYHYYHCYHCFNNHH